MDVPKRVDDQPHQTTILVVDDDERILRLIAEMLTLAGYRVLKASGPYPAIRTFECNASHIDLLLSDLQMPGMNGQQLSARLCAARPGLPVVLMSGYAGPVACTQNVLEKPFAMAELHRKVADALQRHAHN